MMRAEEKFLLRVLDEPEADLLRRTIAARAMLASFGRVIAELDRTRETPGNCAFAAMALAAHEAAVAYRSVSGR